MGSAQFISVGDQPDMNIQSFVISGADLNNVSIQTLDSAGRTVDTFSWNDWMYETPCWVDNDLNVATRSFAPGEGVWIQGVAGYTLQTAGQVNQMDVEVVLRDGFTAIGNPYPINVAIQDIVVTGADLNNVSIQTLDSAGRTVDTFSWNDWMYETPCWVDNDLNVATRELNPGEGIWVQGVAGYTLRMPAPEL
jgi:hypothetical protein